MLQLMWYSDVAGVAMCRQQQMTTCIAAVLGNAAVVDVLSLTVAVW